MLAVRIVFVEVRTSAHAVAAHPRRVEVGAAGDRQVGGRGLVAIALALAVDGERLVRGVARNRRGDRLALALPGREIAVEGAVLHEIAERGGIGHEEDARLGDVTDAVRRDREAETACAGGVPRGREGQLEGLGRARLERQGLGLGLAPLGILGRDRERTRLGIGIGDRHRERDRLDVGDMLRERRRRRRGPEEERCVELQLVQVAAFDDNRHVSRDDLAVRDRLFVALEVNDRERTLRRHCDGHIVGAGRREEENGLAVVLEEMADGLAEIELADRLRIGELALDDRERRGDRTRRAEVEHVAPVAARVGIAAEVGDERRAGAEFVRPAGHDVMALDERLLEGHVRRIVPDRIALRRLVVRDPHVLDAAHGQVVLRLTHAFERGIVHRQHINVLRDTGIQQVDTVGVRPKAAGELADEVRIVLLDGLIADAADVDVFLDRILAGLAGHDLVQELEAVELALVALGERVDAVRPVLELERRGLELARLAHFGRQRPSGRSVQLDPRLQTGRGVVVNRRVESVKRELPTHRLDALPRCEVTAEREAHVVGERGEVAVADVGDAKRGRSTRDAIEARDASEVTEVLEVRPVLAQAGHRDRQ